MSLCLKVNLLDSKSKLILAKVNPENATLFKLELNRIYSTDENGDIIAIYELIFTLTTTEGPLIINVPIQEAGINEYIDSSILITLINDGSTLSMYRNSELTTSVPYNVLLPSYEHSHLTNNLPGYDTPLYAWTYTPEGSSTPYIVYTTDYPTINEGTVLYDRDFNAVRQNKDSFHIVAENNTFVIKYKDYSTEYSEEYDRVYSSTGRYVKDIIVASGTLTADELYYITNLTDTNFRFTSVSNTESVQNISE